MNELEPFSLNRVANKLPCVHLAPNNGPYDWNSDFSVKLLRLFRLIIFKKPIHCVVSYPIHSQSETNSLLSKNLKTVSICKEILLNGCNGLLRAYGKEFPVSEPQIYLSTQHVLCTPREVFTTTDGKRNTGIERLQCTRRGFSIHRCFLAPSHSVWIANCIGRNKLFILKYFINSLLFGTKNIIILFLKSLSV